MFRNPNAFEYLLFNLAEWDSISRLEKVRASLYFLADRKVPSDWQEVSKIVEQFEIHFRDKKVVRIRG